jgi:hypothetical protein
MKRIFKTTVQTGDTIKIKVRRELKGAYLLVDAFIAGRWVRGYYATAFYMGSEEQINGYISFDWEESKRLPKGYKYGVWVLSKETDKQLERIYYKLLEKKERAEKRFEKFLQKMAKLDAEHLEKVKNYAEELLEWRKQGR